jgi:hypothetical protein
MRLTLAAARTGRSWNMQQGHNSAGAMSAASATTGASGASASTGNPEATAMLRATDVYRTAASAARITISAEHNAGN